MNMKTPINHKTEFIELLTNFIFNIDYYKEENPDGKIRWDEEHGEWGFAPRKKYWNFDIAINGYKLTNTIENFKKGRYGEFLEENQNSFMEHYNISVLPSLSKSDCFDLLNKHLGKLEYIKSQFHVEKHTDEISPTFYDVLHHPKVTIIYSDNSKVYDEENDRFVNELISSFVLRQKEVIYSTIDYLNRKIQWLNLSDKDAFIPEKITSTNEYPVMHKLNWCKSDTDLLELITALYEMESFGSKKNITRKEVIDIFSKIFNLEIKDAESKLSRATERKKDISPFLTDLKVSFDNYAIKKEQKKDSR